MIFLFLVGISFSLRSCEANIVVSKTDLIDYVAPQEFYECDSTSAVINEGIILIGNEAFRGCTNLKTVSLPNSLIYLKFNSFRSCTALTTINVPEGVEVIEEGVFRVCTSLTTITLPSTLASIGIASFQETMVSLTSISFPNGNPIFKASNLMVYTNKSIVICSNAITSIVWPSDEYITDITTHAFLFCRLITSMILPNSIITIGERSFYGMENLVTLTLGQSVTSFARDTVENCQNLEAINVDENNLDYCSVNGVMFTKSIEELYFYPSNKPGEVYQIPKETIRFSISSLSETKFLQRFTIEEGNLVLKVDSTDGQVYSIDGTTLVKVAPKVSTFILKTDLTTIGPGAFYTSSITSLEIPSNIKIIEEYCFQIAKISTITIPQTVQEIGEGFFYSSYIESIVIKSQIKILPMNSFTNSGNLWKVELPDTIEIIGNFSLGRCPRLSEVNIPSNLIEIRTGGFYYCSSLPEITFPDSLTYIGPNAFESCIGFQNIIIPKNVYMVDSRAFSTCTNVETVTFMNCNTQNKSNTFYSIPNLQEPICISSKTFTYHMALKPSFRPFFFSLFTFLNNDY
ncbi:hypothetical protein TRFO_40121 [Tritrichomonas foetus]|uniref:Surface antigen BspA-like n=1 Tax=Tritrichomonas foetus TaxID=1144522 RepID=A0A1J4J620_9EUKA|nr:hypothetical protein TRFO_40121 [Tritrichomonas foetus]|eukprot:OHS93599.1 hypothetical protein TRFO_40121 [Tritrichomonas foetus]